MKSILQLTFIIFTLILSSFSLAQKVDKGIVYFQSGRFEEAAAFWEETLATLSADRSPAAYLDTSIQLAAAYQALGRLQRALEVLHNAKLIAGKLNDSVSDANILSQISDIYLAMRDLTREDLRQLLRLSLDDASPTVVMERAQHYLELAEEMVRHADTNSEARLILANILNKKGNFFVIQKKYERALESYEESERLAEKAGDAVLAVKSSLNRLQALIDSGETDAVNDKLRLILQRVERLPDSHDKAFTLIRLASLAQSSLPSDLVNTYAVETLQRALAVAEKLQDNLAIAYAKGDLAQLYAKERRYEEAIRLTRETIYDSPSTLWKRPELLFRWQWQLGKYLKARGEFEEAQDVYERAKGQLQRVRKIYRCGPEAVCNDVQSFYSEWMDLLLQHSSSDGSKADETKRLEEVIKSIESFREADLLIDLNPSPCPKQPLESPCSQLPKGTAVLYLLVLDDRLELLLASRSGIQKFTVLVNRYELTIAIRRQNEFQKSSVSFRLPPRLATNLYQWLIKPIERSLEEQEIDTLVMVPYGDLTLLPFAALYDDDDKKYLVEKYALAIIPGLKFTDFTTPPQSGPIRALLAGASTFKQPSLKAKRELDDNMEMGLPGLPPLFLSPLPYTSGELDNIEKILKERGNVEILKDKEFTVPELEAKLRKPASYSIIHFSTRGYLSDSPGETFLQTYDARLSMNELWELINPQNVGQPLDLLTLSASYTALGGERSSLVELMGIALKTEARSVLASLQKVSDEATAKLMTGFYQQWQKNGFSDKAKALQQAQLELLNTPDFEHPYYWASFVLIGNWQ